MLFDSVLIIGLGLIGGSLALDIKGLNIANKVIGCSRSESTLKTAIENKVVDEVYDDISEAVPKADLIVVCVPVCTSEKIFSLIKEGLGDKKVLITDAGSTKAGVVEAGNVFSGTKAEFVGSHPIAGSHLQGIKNARTGLFKDAVCVITPTEKTSAESAGSLTKFWTALGMKVIELDPEKHDIILALTSHLPHAVAASLVSQICSDSENHEMLIKLSGTGLDDTTRIAAGPAEIWTDIFIENRKALLETLEQHKKVCEQLAEMLKTQDKERLFAWLDEASKSKTKWNEMRKCPDQ